MCGPAGTGKSTYVSKKIISEDKFCHHSSRDTIRFGLLKEGEHYFAREDEVFDLFCEDINETLHSDLYDCVFADATHLTVKSRQKTLDKLNLKNIDIVPVFMEVPYVEALRRNSERTGRKFVPEKVITNMFQTYTIPTFGENKYDYAYIIMVSKDGHEFIINKGGTVYA
jgi:predicted kinase